MAFGRRGWMNALEWIRSRESRFEEPLSGISIISRLRIRNDICHVTKVSEGYSGVWRVYNALPTKKIKIGGGPLRNCLVCIIIFSQCLMKFNGQCHQGRHEDTNVGVAWVIGGPLSKGNSQVREVDVRRPYSQRSGRDEWPWARQGVLKRAQLLHHRV